LALELKAILRYRKLVPDEKNCLQSGGRKWFGSSLAEP
jgi:hypothetical protein